MCVPIHPPTKPPIYQNIYTNHLFQLFSENIFQHLLNQKFLPTFFSINVFKFNTDQQQYTNKKNSIAFFENGKFDSDIDLLRVLQQFETTNRQLPFIKKHTNRFLKKQKRNIARK